MKTLAILFPVTILSLMFLNLYKPSTELEKEISECSILNNTVYVTVKIRTYRYHLVPNSLEYWEQVVVTKQKADSTLNSEYQKALPIFNKVKINYN